MHGYKWIADKDGDVYIICLQADLYKKLPYKKHDSEWYSEDCTVKNITRFRDGMEFGSISGRAYYDFSYWVGQRIRGERIFFCATMDDLILHECMVIRSSLIRYAKKFNGNLPKIRHVGHSLRVRKKRPLLERNSTFSGYFYMVEDPLRMQVFIKR